MSGRPLKYGVIAAAGKGTRAYPRTSYVPKPLFTFENQTLLEKNVYIQLKVLKVPELYIIVGHLKEQVLSEVERIRRHYPHAKIHTAEWTGKGLASDIAALGDRIDGDFSVILGDEFYMDMNHQALAKLWSQKKKAEAMIAVLKSDLLS
ncbi:MAG TPA: sugar phosphate nucleotidyltransferase, partial [Leptospiraceae bacterium]|nr:sugar phosphate nucleotidyltransferase [Leptospiraceae bacterium]